MKMWAAELPLTQYNRHSNTVCPIKTKSMVSQNFPQMSETGDEPLEDW